MTQTSTTQLEGNTKPEGFELFVLRLNKKIRSVDPYLTVAGIGLWLFAYWVLCEGLEIWRFNKLPGPVAISKDWFSTTPFQGISIFTQEYYDHIAVSCQRILFAFGLATGLGVPLGLFMGWSRSCLLYTSPSPRDGQISRMPSSA